MLAFSLGVSFVWLGTLFILIGYHTGSVKRRYAFTITNLRTGTLLIRLTTAECNSLFTPGDLWEVTDYHRRPILKRKSITLIESGNETAEVGENGLHLVENAG